MNNYYDENLILAGWCSSTFQSYLDFIWNGRDLFVYISKDEKIWYSRAELILQYNLPLLLFP
jgi:hypothetical protein